ncbi:MAG: adenosine deaminase family protein [Spirochaetota bacterium]
MHTYSHDFLTEIPKTDLHVHLDGSLRLSTLIELASQHKVNLPSFTEAGLKETVFKETYRNLDEYLAGFQWTTAVLQTPEALERVAYELAMDNFNEGVRYLEVRFAPQLNMSRELGFEGVMHAVDRGLRNARSEINRGLDADEPPFEYGIIVCAMRFFTEAFSQYYADLVRVLRYSTLQEVIQRASLELAKATVALKYESDVQVVGFDLAGSERGFPAGAHQAAYAYAHKHFLRKTVHAGEAYGPESIFQAITKLHADRLGHGMRLFAADMIEAPDITDPKAYCEELADYIAENRTTVEVCLTSNLQTSPDIPDIASHSLGKMLDHRMSVTLCTDNRLVSNTTVTDEIKLATDNINITPKQLKNMIIYGFKRSFHYNSYSDKRAYVRKIINYYEKIAAKHGVAE